MIKELLNTIKLWYTKYMINEELRDFKDSFQGVILEDPRPQEEQDKDYSEAEIVISAGASQYRDFEVSQLDFWRKTLGDKDGNLPNQTTSSSCVFYAHCTALSLLFSLREYDMFTRLSPVIYSNRTNFPNLGSIPFTEALRMIKGENKPILYEFEPTDEQGEGFYIDRRGKTYKAIQYILSKHITDNVKAFNIRSLKIDNLANLTQTGTLSITLHGGQKNYWGHFIPKEGGDIDFGHQVAVLDAVMYKGEKALLVTDSSYRKSTDNYGFRILTESFLKKHLVRGVMFHRGIYLREEMRKIENTTTPTEPCSLGDRNENVKKVQEWLIKLGYLRPEYNTGYYGSLTAKSVLAFQLAYITSIKKERLEKHQGHNWSKLSIEAAKLADKERKHGK